MRPTKSYLLQLNSPKCLEVEFYELPQESFKKSPIGRLFRSSQ
jgi:hypothetical protein